MLSGIVLLNKPKNLSSFKALIPLKRSLGISRVGHCGTLDPFAEGLIIALVGSLTRLTSYFHTMKKCYRAIIHFGIETDTLDPEGVPVEYAEPPSEERLKAAIADFCGHIVQIPPRYSAMHVNGKRAYQLSRQGFQFLMKPRTVEIYSLRLIKYQPPEGVFDIECGTGVYIRSLGRDLARACSSVGYISRLRRVSIGPFSVNDSVSPYDNDLCDRLISSYNLCDYIKEIVPLFVDQKTATTISNGILPKNILAKIADETYCALFNDTQQLLAICYCLQGNWKFLFVSPGTL